MAKYMRKCKLIGETVMEVTQVGVTTRARTLAKKAAEEEEEEETTETETSEGVTKRRKIDSEELQFKSSRLPLIMTENQVSPVISSNSDQVITEDRFSSPNSDHVHVSWCSSNGSTEVLKEKLRSVDLEGEDDCFQIENSTINSDGRQRRETTPSISESGDLESTAKPSDEEANSRFRSSAEKKMPTEAEIEELFSVAEKEEQKRFTDKYNFDIVKEAPLEGGRYEWVRVKP